MQKVAERRKAELETFLRQLLTQANEIAEVQLFKLYQPLFDVVSKC